MGRKGRFGIPMPELALCIVIAAIVLAVLGERIDLTLELLEKTAIETQIMNMRSGLRLEKARRIAAGQSLLDLAGQSPFAFIDRPFVGEDNQKLINLSNLSKSPSLQYETMQNVVAYAPARQRHLKMLQAGADKVLKWQLQARSAEEGGVDIVLITPYEWF